MSIKSNQVSNQAQILVNIDGDEFRYDPISYDQSLPYTYNDQYIPSACSSCKVINCLCLSGIKMILSDAFEHIEIVDANGKDDFLKKVFDAFEIFEMIEYSIDDIRNGQLEAIISELAKMCLQNNVSNLKCIPVNEKDYYRYRFDCLISTCKNSPDALIENIKKNINY